MSSDKSLDTGLSQSQARLPLDQVDVAFVARMADPLEKSSPTIATAAPASSQTNGPVAHKIGIPSTDHHHHHPSIDIVMMIKDEPVTEPPPDVALHPRRSNSRGSSKTPIERNDDGDGDGDDRDDGRIVPISSSTCRRSSHDPENVPTPRTMTLLSMNTSRDVAAADGMDVRSMAQPSGKTISSFDAKTNIRVKEVRSSSKYPSLDRVLFHSLIGRPSIVPQIIMIYIYIYIYIYMMMVVHVQM
jgi:hypothetical protein